MTEYSPSLLSPDDGGVAAMAHEIAGHSQQALGDRLGRGKCGEGGVERSPEASFVCARVRRGTYNTANSKSGCDVVLA